jgi:hypothetical protein
MLDHPLFFEITTGVTIIIKKVNIESVLYSLLKNKVLNIFKTFLKWLIKRAYFLVLRIFIF